MYIFGGGLYLEFQYDIKISAAVIPNITPPLIPKLHKSPNGIIDYVLVEKAL